MEDHRTYSEKSEGIVQFHSTSRLYISVWYIYYASLDLIQSVLGVTWNERTRNPVRLIIIFLTARFLFLDKWNWAVLSRSAITTGHFTLEMEAVRISEIPAIQPTSTRLHLPGYETMLPCKWLQIFHRNCYTKLKLFGYFHTVPLPETGFTLTLNWMKMWNVLLQEYRNSRHQVAQVTKFVMMALHIFIFIIQNLCIFI
jgi:hypothetical protein